jgi:hypothetical protein
MPKLRAPSLPTRLTRLFEAPTTWSYAGLTLVLGGLAASLVFSSNALPILAKYLVMLATMGWLARLCDSTAQRWAWVGLVALLVLGLGLEVSASLLR